MTENSIFLKFIADADMSEADKALEGQKKEIQGVIDKMASLSKAALEDEKSIKDQGLARDRLNAALERNAKYYAEQYKELKQEVAQRKKSIVTLEQNAKAMNLLSNSTDSARKKLNEMRNLMAQMEDEGNLGEVYERVATAASRLTDQMGDLQQRINVLASDTKNLDAAMSLGSGIAGAFNVATSAAALLGGENEKLQQAFLKVQAAMAILNGVQQVANVLQKESAASVVINNALMKIKARVTGQATAATTAATSAQVAFNASMLANPVMWLVAGIAALVAGVVALVGHYREAAIEARGFAQALEDLKEKDKELADQGEYAKRMAEAQGKAWQEVAEVEKQALIRRRNNAIREYNKLAKAANAVNGKISDEEKKHIEEAKAKVDELAEAWDKFWDDYAIKEIQAMHDQEEREKEAAKRRREERRREAIEAAETQRIAMEIMQKQMNNRGKAIEIKVQPVIEDPEEADDSVIEYFKKRKELGLVSEETLRNETLMGYKILETKGIISHKEYLELKKKLDDEYNQSQIAKAQEVFDYVANFATQAFNVFRDAMSSAIQAQIDELEQMYTTDAELAKKDADKKYLSEKELEKKKAELTLRQQRLNKAAAIFQIGLDTAAAIIRFLSNPGGVAGITLSAMAGVMGAAQLAVAAAKPLPQYAKGRKGGKGEMALVGEKGPELMYVPAGASIVPNSKLYDAGAWGAYGIPKTAIPAMPNINGAELAELYGMRGGGIDYDKLGRAVASNMPKLNPVNVSVDRNGVMVQSGHETRVYLNTKYAGQWN